MSETKEYKLEGVIYRDYEFNDGEKRVTYRVNNPVSFWYREGGETHRVVDSEGVVHIVPAPGVHGCVMRYKKAEGYPPVAF